MKIFRHKENGMLYSIQQIGRGKNISPPQNWKSFYAQPYRTNLNAPEIPLLGNPPDLQDFTLAFEE